MALLVKKEVTNGSLFIDGVYIQLKPILVYGIDSTTIPTDRGIWVDEADYLAHSENPTVPTLVEIPDAFYIDPATAPQGDASETVLNDFLIWINEQAKLQILAKNPTWTSADIDVVGL